MKTQDYRLYGRQQSRPLSVGQQELYDQLLPNIDIDIQELTKAKQAVLEIGFGHGDHLGALASHNQETLYIGCEPFINGVASLLMLMDNHNIKNIRIHHADVRKLYHELPGNVFDSIYLLFPDPWPKKRHWKRRFIQATTFAEIFQFLKPQGLWYIATDHLDYQNWIENFLQAPCAQEYFELTNSTTLTTPWDGFEATKYQKKAVQHGRCPQYYILKSRKK